MKKTVIILVMLLSYTGIFADSIPGELVEFKSTSLNISFNNLDMVYLQVVPYQYHVFNIEPAISLTHYDIGQDNEQSYWLSFSPSVYFKDMRNSTVGANMSGGIQSITYLNPGSTMPVGFDFSAACYGGSINLNYHQVTADSIEINLGTFIGRSINQLFPLRVKFLCDELGIELTPAEAREAARVLARNIYSLSRNSDNAKRGFVYEISELLGLQGREYEVLQSLEKVSVYRYARTGSNLGALVKSYIDADTLCMYLYPYVYARTDGNISDSIWYKAYSQCYSYLGYYDLDDYNTSGLSINSVNGKFGVGLYWYPSAGVEYTLDTVLVLEDILDTGFSLDSGELSTVLGVENRIGDNLYLGLEVPLSIYPQLAMDINIGISWNLF